MKKITRKQITYIIVALVIGMSGGVAWLMPLSEPTTPLTVSPPSRPESDAPAPAEHTVIAVGDSLTAGFGLPAAEAYPAYLEQGLLQAGFSVRVINAGVSGETTRGTRERAEFIRRQNPDVVLLGIGGNDALRFIPITETETNLRSILDTLLSGEAPPTVILLTMQAPLNAGAEYKRDFDALFSVLSTEYNLVQAPFITPTVFGNPNLLLPDGIHPTREGYRRIVDSYLITPVSAALANHATR